MTAQGKQPKEEEDLDALLLEFGHALGEDQSSSTGPPHLTLPSRLLRLRIFRESGDAFVGGMLRLHAAVSLSTMRLWSVTLKNQAN